MQFMLLKGFAQTRGVGNFSTRSRSNIATCSRKISRTVLGDTPISCATSRKGRRSDLRWR